MKCRYRHPFMRRELLSVAYKLGSADLDLTGAHYDAAKCFLEEHHTGPHLVINPWDNTVHGYFERAK